MGRNDSVIRIPGPWARAAASAFPDSFTTRAYREAARWSGVEPLSDPALSAERSFHVMGLYRRTELLQASRRTLESIRASIPSDTTRARFDRLFRPRGEWIVDLHDAALDWARLRMPGIHWRAVRAALGAAHRIPSAVDSVNEETLLRGMYALAVLAATDSSAFAATRTDMWRSDSNSTAAVLIFLRGYTEALHWYTEVIGFFLNEPWLPQAKSLRELVRTDWTSVAGQGFDPDLPRIETRLFGNPQAVPQYGIPPELFSRLVSARNPNATEWLRQHGQGALLRSLRWLPRGDTSLTLLRNGSENLRLTTVPRQSRESLNGFLEPRDAVAIDPGYSPLLAIGAVIHEWQHLLFRRRQLELFARGLAPRDSAFVELPGVQPHLAEGFAEWSAERILGPVAVRWPLLTLGELEKRADLARPGSQDQHTIGYALIRALGEALPAPGATTALLLRHAEDPSRIPAEPVLRNAWARYNGSSGQTLRTSMYPILTPEVTFTMDRDFPDVVTTRILVPARADAVR